MNQRLNLLRRSPIRKITEQARTIPDCRMLTLGEPDFPTPEPIIRAAVASLGAGRTHYAPNAGTDGLRKAIAQREQVDVSRVLVTVGATGALYTALTGILNPGEEVIIPTPAFNLYESIVLAAGAVPVFLNLSEHNFQIDENALKKAITPKTRAIVLNSPNNPTGCVLDEASLRAVKRAVAHTSIYIVWDAVYQQLSYGDCPTLWGDPDLEKNLLLCQSFSKPYAMTGWRAGYLIAPEQLAPRLLLLHAAEVACVPTFVQDACTVALSVDVSPMYREYRARRDYVTSRLREMGLSFPEPMGAFYVFPDIAQTGLTAEEFTVSLMEKAKVAVVPGDCFGSDHHVRISYACSMEQLQEAMDRMEHFLQTL